jgi:hypothetical protein
MSNSFEITQEVLSTRNNFLSTPFAPSIQVVGESAEIIFNQAYVFDYLGYSYPTVIEDMDIPYDLGDQDYFYVEITFYTGSGGVSGARFKKETELLSFDDPLYIQTTNASEQTNETVNLLIADIESGKIKELYFRDNIQWWGRLIKQNNSSNTNVAHPIADPEVALNQPLIIKAISGYGDPDYGKIVDVFDSTDPSGDAIIIVSGITGYGVMYGDGPEGQETYKFLGYPDGVAQSANDSPDSNGWEWRLIAAGDPPNAPAWSEKQYLPQVAEGAAQGDILYYDEDDEQWEVLDIPTGAAESEAGYSSSWEWRLIAAGDPPDSPAWSERQYLPQAAEGAKQGDILYYDATNKQWEMLIAPDTSLYTGDPVLHHDGDKPYWGTDDVGGGDGETIIINTGDTYITIITGDTNDYTTTGLYVCVNGSPRLVNFVISA